MDLRAIAIWATFMILLSKLVRVNKIYLSVLSFILKNVMRLALIVAVVVPAYAHNAMEMQFYLESVQTIVDVCQDILAILTRPPVLVIFYNLIYVKEKACASSCASCYGSATNCISCSANQIINANGQCQCISGYYPAPISGICIRNITSF